jgi:hypothetical protein
MFAVVQWEGVEPAQLMKRLVGAVTEWVKSTEDGQTAWHNSGHDFGIGDLVHWLDPPAPPATPGQLAEDLRPPDDLTRILKKYNIHNLTVEVYVFDEEGCEWDFDDLLVDEDKLIAT